MKNWYNVRVDKIKAIVKHRNKVIELEKKYMGKNQILTYLHDFDKIILLLIPIIPYRFVGKIHRFYSHHHVNNKIGWFNFQEMYFDWDSARYTKPNKQLKPVDTAKKYHPEMLEKIINFEKEIKSHFKYI